VLVGLANHAGPDGTGAFPSVATLVRYTGLSERTVRTCLDRLAAEGIIAPCDPDIVTARIKRADRRPQGWDMNLSLVRHDLDDAASPHWRISSQVLSGRFAAAAQPGADGQANGCKSPPPLPLAGDGCLPMSTSGWLGSSARHGEWGADPDRARCADPGV
jgi:hypothetical protein